MIDQATSILLPSAKVSVFSVDPETIKTAEQISADWRFARVHTQVNKGDVSAAITQYSESASPDLIIIQSNAIDDKFIDELATLAGYCNEDTGAIVIGPENDVNLYRKLIDMGISDYLVRPLTSQSLGEVIAKTLIEKLGVSSSRLIACAGGKGGVGTSVMAQALSWGVADILKQKTLFIDLAGGWSTASVGIGFDPATTISEAVGAAENEDEDSINRVIHKASDHLHVLANGAESMLGPQVSGAELEHLIDYAMARYPAVIVDLSHALPPLMYTVLSRAHHTFLFSTPSVSSLRFTRALMQEIKTLRGEQDSGTDLIINHTKTASKADISAKDIEQVMEIKPAATIEYMPDLIAACETSEKHILDFKEGQLLLKKQLLPRLADLIKTDSYDDVVEEDEKGDLLGGILSAFGGGR